MGESEIKKEVKYIKIIHPITFDGIYKLMQMAKQGWQIFGSRDGKTESEIYLEKNGK